MPVESTPTRLCRCKERPVTRWQRLPQPTRQLFQLFRGAGLAEPKSRLAIECNLRVIQLRLDEHLDQRLKIRISQPL